MAIITYSIDLRERVLEYIESGRSQWSASKIFNVSTSAINRWWIRYKEEGIRHPIARKGSKGKVPKDELVEFVHNNPNMTLYEASKRFGVSMAAISKLLKKLNFSYKKKPSPMWKQVKRSVKPTKNS